MKKKSIELSLLVLLQYVYFSNCNLQEGPDPWNIVDDKLPKNTEYLNIPPDLRIPLEPKKNSVNLNSGEWFFKRLLSIVLKGGKIKTYEDNSVEILLKLHLEPKKWQTLSELLKPTTAPDDDMLRRSLGYLEEAIQPTIADKLALAWSDYIQIYLSEYKSHITWISGVLGAAFFIGWLWNKLSHKHFMIIVFISLYLYEGFVSYKEAEKQELDRFLSAMESCSWAFWFTSCEVPKPDPIKFLKHMSPLKIGIRMFTTIISEPIVMLSDTLKTMIHGMTDGLWYPLDKIVYGFLILTFNVMLLLILIMVVFNFILNIPFKLNFFGVSLGVQQRRRSIFSNTSINHNHGNDNSDRISGQTLDRLLDVFSRALPPVQTNVQPINTPNTLPPVQTNVQPINTPNTNRNLGIRRSASTGRLDQLALDNTPRMRHFANLRRIDGSGDAH